MPGNMRPGAFGNKDSAMKKLERNCEDCIAYWNMLEGDICGLGFEVMEYSETVLDEWRSGVCPREHACDAVPMPKTAEEFLQLAHLLNIDWDENEVMEPYQ